MKMGCGVFNSITYVLRLNECYWIVVFVCLLLLIRQIDEQAMQSLCVDRILAKHVD